MKLSVKFIFLVVSIAFIHSAVAQAPGYMGKRFVAGYGFSTSPAIFGSNGKGNSIFGRSGGNANDGTFAFNIHHEGFVEYALSKKMMLGFSARFYKTSYDNKRSAIGQIYYPGYSYSQYVSESPEGLYYINGLNLTLYGKLYFGKYIAPWGRYMLFGPTIRRYTCSYDPSEMRIPVNIYTTPKQYFSDFGPEKQTFTRFDISFGLGRTRVLYNRLTLDYGFNMQVFAFAATFFDAMDEGLFGGSDNPEADLYMKKTAPWRVRGANRFNVFLKIGVLLF